MSERAGFFERGVEWLVRHISGWQALALTLVLYPGVGLVLPVAAGFSTYYLVIFNLVGVVMAAVISLGWIEVLREAIHRRHLLDWTTELRHLNSREFEWLVGEVFRREGWNIRETGRIDGPDGNVDLVLTRGSERMIVQCKRWQAWPVGVDEIRMFLGTLTREKLSPISGIFVTLSDFTQQAREEASTAGLVLVDGPDLHLRIERVQRKEPCPECGAPMTLAKSPYGWWLRCQVRNCRGKRDLGRDPAIAVEVLMTPATDGLHHT
jgi:HJR/Mrr/RecB family endonuclease